MPHPDLVERLEKAEADREDFATIAFANQKRYERARAEVERLRGERKHIKAEASKLVVLMETFIYEPHRMSQGGLIAAINLFMTDQEIPALALPEKPEEQE